MPLRSVGLLVRLNAQKQSVVGRYVRMPWGLASVGVPPARAAYR